MGLRNPKWPGDSLTFPVSETIVASPEKAVFSPWGLQFPRQQQSRFPGKGGKILSGLLDEIVRRVAPTARPWSKCILAMEGESHVLVSDQNISYKKESYLSRLWPPNWAMTESAVSHFTARLSQLLPSDGVCGKISSFRRHELTAALLLLWNEVMIRCSVGGTHQWWTNHSVSSQTGSGCWQKHER